MDHVLVVPDNVLIELFKSFSSLGDNYLDLISKEAMGNNPKVQSIVAENIAKFQNKLFYDISQDCFENIDVDGKGLVCNKV